MIGRKQEIELLEQAYNSSRSEFIAIYGRRRVGKTFLVRQLFTDKSYPYILSDKDTKELNRWLKYCGCIGIDVDNYTNKGYSTIRFREIGFGVFSYRFYDKPLSRQEQDSINNDECLIVYNDSTVFEFGAGVLGAQCFPGKEEFMEKLHNSKMECGL